MERPEESDSHEHCYVCADRSFGWATVGNQRNNASFDCALHESAEEAAASFAPFFQMAVFGASEREKCYRSCVCLKMDTCARNTK